MKKWEFCFLFFIDFCLQENLWDQPILFFGDFGDERILQRDWKDNKESVKH